MNSDDERRKTWRAYRDEWEHVHAEWEVARRRHEEAADDWYQSHPFSRGAYPAPPKPPRFPPFPEELRGLTCGAKTRQGHPCRRTDLHRNGRCKFHGGLSTGPRTTEGKRRAAENGNKPKRKQSP